MKREGFWRDVTPPLNIYGVPLPFTMIYLFLAPYPSKTTFWICTGILAFFVLLGYTGWTVRTLSRRLLSQLQGTVASYARGGTGILWKSRETTTGQTDAIIASVICQETIKIIIFIYISKRTWRSVKSTNGRHDE